MLKGCLILGVFLSANVFAMESQTYIGVSLGQSNWKGDDFDCSYSNSCKKNPIAANIFVGTSLSDNFIVEGGLISLGQYSESISNATYDGNFQAKKTGVNVDMLGVLPINDSVVILPRLGILLASNQAEASVKYSSTELTRSSSKSSSDLSFRYGVGVEFNVDKSISVGFDYITSKFKLDDLSTDISVIGLNFKYGL